MARSVLIVSGFLALLLGGCMGGPSQDSASLASSADEPAAARRTVSVPTRLSAGGRGTASGSLLILGVN